MSSRFRRWSRPMHRRHTVSHLVKYLLRVLRQNSSMVYPPFSVQLVRQAREMTHLARPVVKKQPAEPPQHVPHPLGAGGAGRAHLALRPAPPLSPPGRGTQTLPAAQLRVTARAARAGGARVAREPVGGVQLRRGPRAEGPARCAPAAGRADRFTDHFRSQRPRPCLQQSRRSRARGGLARTSPPAAGAG
jgi:hypothetical protein